MDDDGVDLLSFASPPCRRDRDAVSAFAAVNHLQSMRSGQAGSLVTSGFVLAGLSLAETVKPAVAAATCPAHSQPSMSLAAGPSSSRRTPGSSWRATKSRSEGKMRVADHPAGQRGVVGMHLLSFRLELRWRAGSQRS